MARHAYARPLAWLDDDFDLRPAARSAFLDRRDAATLLVPVDPAVGMTDVPKAHLDEIESWTRGR